MLTYFYDIESVKNAFTLANWRTQDNEVDVYVLVDDFEKIIGQKDFSGIVAETIRKRIYAKNLNFNGKITIYDLRDVSSNSRLARTFGLSDTFIINNPSNKSNYHDLFRLVCDTDPDYDENKHPYLFGYNSQNFDTTMLAEYLYRVFPIFSVDNNTRTIFKFNPTTAKKMREVDDELFSSTFRENMPLYLASEWNFNTHSYNRPDYTNPRWRIRKNMLMSGRHIDVARLNEKQQHVALKRIIGMLGGQILESDKLKSDGFIENLDQLADLLAYNVSDVINLDLIVFRHKTYQSNFALKKQLLQTYPELIYSSCSDKYAPDISPQTVRNDRLFIDSSSAQLATKSLCPYGHLKDIPAVSFDYPSKQKAAELNIPRKNILEECNKFFLNLFPQPEVRAEWNRIYTFYKSIEGRNFNNSKNYLYDYPITSSEYIKPENLSNIAKTDTCIYYYDKDGKPTSCFALFSTGGIHGAEYNKEKYEYDMSIWQAKVDLLEKCKIIYPNPIDLKIAKTVTIDGVIYKASEFLKSGSTAKKAEYKDLMGKKPVLFQCDSKGNYKLNTTKNGYAYTSADPTNHEDFTSYYPNLLRMMSAFYNEGLRYDRYAEIFDNKQYYGFLMKPKNANLSPEDSIKYKNIRESAARNVNNLIINPLHVSDEERAIYDVLRDGTKLILNSASGAADANFESNIRMNNQIISMRIIGQLFSWRIAQAQTYHGAKITSTNTDGLYSVLEATENAKILEKESNDIGVEIEPEPTFLISKDTNNRIELDFDNRKIQSVSGGTLGCRNGPTPTKSLSHPAIIDWALSEYLVKVALHDHGLSLNDPFSYKLGREILESAKTQFDSTKWLIMFQNIIASSPSSMSYIFSVDNDNNAKALQHYNRVFIMKNGTANTVNLYKAMAHQISPATLKKRNLENCKPQQHDKLALKILADNGVLIDHIPCDKEATISKYTNIETNWCMFVQNASIYYLSDEQRDFIINNIDMDKYLILLKNAYTNSWMNIIPEHVPVIYEDDNSIPNDINKSKTSKKVSENSKSTDNNITSDTPISEQSDICISVSDYDMSKLVL